MRLIEKITIAKKDPYKILGIDRKATNDEILKAYKELSMKVKGDKKKLKEIEDAFAEINKKMSPVTDKATSKKKGEEEKKKEEKKMVQGKEVKKKIKLIKKKLNLEKDGKKEDKKSTNQEKEEGKKEHPIIEDKKELNNQKEENHFKKDIPENKEDSPNKESDEEPKRKEEGKKAKKAKKEGDDEDEDEMDYEDEEEEDGGMQNIFDLLTGKSKRVQQNRRPKMKPMQFALEATLDQIFTGTTTKYRWSRVRICKDCQGYIIV